MTLAQNWAKQLYPRDKATLVRNENAYNLDIINRHKNIVVLLDGTILTDETSLRDFPRGLGVLPIMAYTGRLRPEGVPFSGFRYMKG